LQGIEPILDRGTWEQLQLILRAPDRVKGGRTGTRLLSSIVRCGNCGEVMQVHARALHRGGAPEYMCSRAPGRKGCGRLSIAALGLERHVTAEVLNRWVVLDKHVITDPDSQANAARVRELEGRLSDLGREYAAGRVSLQAFVTADASLREQLRQAYADHEQDVADRFYTQLPEGASHEQALATFEAMPLPEQRNLVHTILGDIVIKPSLRGSRTFQPERVLFAHQGLHYLAAKG
jgi:hypothetical protein